MQISEKSNSGIVIEFEVSIPRAEVDSKVDQEIQKRAANAKIPGFRKGHAPIDKIRGHFFRESLGAVIQKYANEAAAEVLKREDIKPVVRPMFDVKSFEDGKDLILTVTVEQAPTVSLGDLKEITIEKFDCPVTDQEIDKIFDDLNKDYTRFISVDHEAKPGDAVSADITVKEKGLNRIEQEVPKEIYIIIDHEESPLHKFFSQNLQGKKKDDIVDVVIPPECFRKNKRQESLAVQLKVTDVSEEQPGSFIDDFLKISNFKSLEEMREDLKKEIHEARQKDLNLYYKRIIMDTLSEKYKFQVPSSMIEQDFRNIVNMAKSYDEQQSENNDNEDDEDINDPNTQKEFRDVAERRVRLGFVMREIAKARNVLPSEEAIKSRVQAQFSRMSPRDRKEFKRNSKFQQYLIQQASAQVLEDAIVDVILKEATITETPITVEDLEAKLQEFIPSEFRYDPTSVLKFFRFRFSAIANLKKLAEKEIDANKETEKEIDEQTLDKD